MAHLYEFARVVYGNGSRMVFARGSGEGRGEWEVIGQWHRVSVL